MINGLKRVLLRTFTEDEEALMTPLEKRVVEAFLESPVSFTGVQDGMRVRIDLEDDDGHARTVAYLATEKEIVAAAYFFRLGLEIGASQRA